MRHTFTPDGVLDTNAEGLAIIRAAESFSPTWYLCPANVWTIGYGTTDGSMPGVNRRELRGPITEDKAERLFLRFLVGHTEPVVEAAVKVPLTSNEFSALVSLVYNIGGGAFRASTLLRKLNAGDREGAVREFRRWVYADGKKLRGLVTRRAVEEALFRDIPNADLEANIARLEPLPVQPIHVGRTPLINHLPWT